jgi:deoxyhypusine synthase
MLKQHGYHRIVDVFLPWQEYAALGDEWSERILVA